VDSKREKALIHAAKRGDEAALGELYDANVDKIYRYLFYRVESHEVAEDLTAEVFLRFVEGVSAYQDRDVPLLAWLYQIAHARLVDHYRRTNRVGVEQDIETVTLSIEDDVDVNLMANYQKEKVQAAFTALKEDQRQVLVLRFIEGYNLQQTAESLGKTIGAVKVIQHRALQALNRALTQQGLIYE
jgi:RNA polymerase sigma-70 factor, ECF subfamily